MLSARRQFVEAFLGALGAAEIVECAERASEVRGTLRFAEDCEVLDLSGDADGDLQDFSWQCREGDAPSVLAYRLADILHRFQLVEIDRLRVSREALRTILQNDQPDAPVMPGAFDAAMEELLAVEIALVDAGADTGDFLRLRE